MKTLLTSTPVNRFPAALCLMGLLISLSACEDPELIKPALRSTAQARRATPPLLSTSLPTLCTLVSPATPATKPTIPITLPALPKVIIGQPVKPRRATY